MSFPRYPKYKDSGIEWLGEVPEHWATWKLPYAFEVIGSGTTPKTGNREYYDDGDIPWVNTGDLNDGQLEDCQKRVTEKALADHSSLKLYPPGSLLIAMYGATIGKLAMLQFPATVNQACCVFGGASVIVPEFMFYWFLGLRQQIISLATGGGQPNVSQDILRSLRVARPAPAEQTAIAAFLDRETAKIDGLVAEQRRLMELLKEKRQAVISHAVTKGLNPDAPMKPSGIEWLGDVPEHWSVAHLRRLIRPGTSITYGIIQAGPDIEGGIPYIRTSDMADDSLPESGYMRTTPEIESAYLRSKVSPNDLIVAIRATLGKGLLVPDYLDGANLTQGTARVCPGENLLPRFLLWSFNSDYCQTSIRVVAKGTTFLEITLHALRRIPLAVPPMTEQEAIVTKLDNDVAEFDALIAEAQRAIDLLQERRTALISAAVTGQIDVRQLAKQEAV
jgi:type I restriction enzyme S subunit